MKRPLLGLVALWMASVATAGVGLAADTLNQDVVAHIDPYGDGSMKVTFHLSASQWANWREQYGDHPDVLWRDMKQNYAKFALDKFDLQRNDVDRTATANIEARAFTKVRDDGSRAVEVLKGLRPVSNSGLEWVFEATTQQSPDAPILTQMFRIILPPQATNPHIDEPGTEFQELVYQMPENFGRNSVLLWVGVLATGGGILLGILGFVFSKRPPPLPPLLTTQPPA
jgi:hypothetical protein